MNPNGKRAEKLTNAEQQNQVSQKRLSLSQGKEGAIPTDTCDWELKHKWRGKTNLAWGGIIYLSPFGNRRMP